METGAILLQSKGFDVVQLLFFAGFFVILYVFMILPQQKKQKKQKAFAEAIKKGDYVVTVGGMHGTVSAIEGETILLEVDKTTKIRFEKSSVSLDNTQAITGNEDKK